MGERLPAFPEEGKGPQCAQGGEGGWAVGVDKKPLGLGVFLAIQVQ